MSNVADAFAAGSECAEHVEPYEHDDQQPDRHGNDEEEEYALMREVQRVEHEYGRHGSTRAETAGRRDDLEQLQQELRETGEQAGTKIDEQEFSAAVHFFQDGPCPVKHQQVASEVEEAGVQEQGRDQPPDFAVANGPEIVNGELMHGVAAEIAAQQIQHERSTGGDDDPNRSGAAPPEVEVAARAGPVVIAVVNAHFRARPVGTVATLDLHQFSKRGPKLKLWLRCGLGLDLSSRSTMIVALWV